MWKVAAETITSVSIQETSAFLCICPPVSPFPNRAKLNGLRPKINLPNPKALCPIVFQSLINVWPWKPFISGPLILAIHGFLEEVHWFYLVVFFCLFVSFQTGPCRCGVLLSALVRRISRMRKVLQLKIFPACIHRREFMGTLVFYVKLTFGS